MIKANTHSILEILQPPLLNGYKQVISNKLCTLIALFFLLLFSDLTLFAQTVDKSTYNWYWGIYAAMTFNTPDLEPEMLNTSVMEVVGGGSGVISDKDGVLQFYTNGITVWNRQNQVMAGAPLCTTLFNTAAQQAVVVPQPEDNKDRFYYIFHWGFRDETVFWDDTLFVSRVDMAGAGGLGEVIEKKKVVYPNCYTRFCAVRHANNRDVWLITHSNSGDAYYAFLITKEGISITPVVSHCGYNYPYPIIVTWREFMQISPDGRTVMQPICMGNSTLNPDPYSVDLLRFDNSSGQLYFLTNLTNSSSNFGIPGGGFSPSSKLLYIAEEYGDKRILQYDLTLPPNQIASSEIEIFQDISIKGFGQAQIAPNGELYWGKQSDYISVIERPNLRGAACNFVYEKYCVETNPVNPNFPQGQRNACGLPQFMQSYFNQPDFVWENACIGNQTHFWLPNPEGIDGVEWFFNDPAQPGATSTLWEPQFQFSVVGNYNVKLVYHYSSGTLGTVYDTVVRELTIYNLPTEFTLGSNQTLCQGESGSLTLSGSQNDVNYILWRNGTDSITFLYGNGNSLTYNDINQAGTYSVEALHTIGGCSNSMLGSPIITFAANPQQYNFAQTAEICQGESCTLTLPGSELGTSYHLIKNLATIQTLVGNGTALDFDNITETGNYTVEAESVDNCTAVMLGIATVTVGLSPQEFLLSGGGKICQGYFLDITLSSSETSTTYTLFKDGVATTTTLPGTGLELIFENISTSGTYTIEAENNNNGCKTEMDGTAVVEVAARPVANSIRFH